MTAYLQQLIIRDIMEAKMPDGSPIRDEVKAATLLSHLVPGEVSPALRKLFLMGVQSGSNQMRRSPKPFYA